MTLSRIGVTLGDPGGIGPEIVLRSLYSGSLPAERQYVIFGPEELLTRQGKALGIGGKPAVEFDVNEIDCEISRIKWGGSGEENGRVSYESFSKAVEAARRGDLDAVVTAPVSKYSWSLAGIKWAGHTEYLDALYPGSIMSFWSDNLRVALFSHHVPLSEAVKRIKRGDLERFLLHLHDCLHRLGLDGVTLLVSGLNPHAGESGLLGREEEEEIQPALGAVRRRGIEAEGPFPPDVVFRMAYGRSDRMVVALYHDQGLIPFKLDAFDSGVNATLGLPFVRTSPDHGTAFDIAGASTASPESLIRAVQLAEGFIPRQD